MPLIISLFLTLFIGILTVHGAGNVIELEEFNFDQWVGKGKAAFVEYWAPWCDHCQQLSPIWEQLGDAFSHMKEKVVIAKVNADAAGSKSLLEEHGIQALPTLRYFDGKGRSEDYNNEEARTLEAFADFVTSKSGIRSNLPPPPPPPPSIVTQLNGNNFEEIVNNPDKDVLVAFTATWCPHCKKLKPIYNKIAWDFKRERNVVVAELDADTDPSRSIANKFNITGYPLIKLFPKGEKNKKTPIDFQKTRDEKSLVDFVNKYALTHRVIGGGLSEKAGRNDHLDKMSEVFVKATPAERERLYRQVKPVTVAVGEHGKHYLNIMEKLMKGEGEDYLFKEGKRLIGLLRKKSLSEEKLDDIKIKANILAAFVKGAVDQQKSTGAQATPSSTSSPKKHTKEEL